MARMTTKGTKTLSIINKSSNRTKFDYSEAFRQIRTNIEFSNVEKNTNVISVTSTRIGEGKTTLAINLAYSFAMKYKKVLLIDCDLRKSSVHRYLGIPNDNGLTDTFRLMSNTKSFDLQFINELENPNFLGTLSVLTAGTRVYNPSELLGLNAFKSLIDHLRNEYDYIILDCAPIGSISDVIPVSLAADGTIYVVSSKSTKRKEALNYINLLKRNNVNILGGVLTRIDKNEDSYAYYYY